jgi:hypothetical protein
VIQLTIGLEVYTILLIMLLHYFKESHVSKNCRYHIAGNFLGVKFSWITKKNYWWSKIRISRWKEIISIRKMASNSNSFEVEAMMSTKTFVKVKLVTIFNVKGKQVILRSFTHQ